MPQRCIGALTIGQSPRPDLVEPLTKMFPDYEIIQAGALDGMEIDELPDTEGDAYPLVTRMRDSRLVMVAENFIEPLLQDALDRLESEGVAANLLMCAGTFANLQGTQPLYKPFDIGQSVLRSMGIKSIGLIAPVPEQEAPIRQRWESAGWDAVVWTEDIRKQDQRFHQQLKGQILRHNLECIVLDYFGHPVELVNDLQSSVEIPVFDLGYLAITTLASKA
ncbi:MAG: AroM family protein [Chloroflexi bacterium]|nr:AroM family protein [Chloroflexota bacterium]